VYVQAALCHPLHANPQRLLDPLTSQGRPTGHWAERLFPLPPPPPHVLALFACARPLVWSAALEIAEIAQRCLGARLPAASSSCAAPHVHSAAGEATVFTSSHTSHRGGRPSHRRMLPCEEASCRGLKVDDKGRVQLEQCTEGRVGLKGIDMEGLEHGRKPRLQRGDSAGVLGLRGGGEDSRGARGAARSW